MLAEGGNRVTIFEMADRVAPGAWFQQVRDIVPKLNKAGTRIHLGCKLTKITDNRIYVEDVLKKERFYEGSMVVLPLGVKSENALVKELEGRCENVFCRRRRRQRQIYYRLDPPCIRAGKKSEVSTGRSDNTPSLNKEHNLFF